MIQPHSSDHVCVWSPTLLCVEIDIDEVNIANCSTRRTSSQSWWQMQSIQDKTFWFRKFHKWSNITQSQRIMMIGGKYLGSYSMLELEFIWLWDSAHVIWLRLYLSTYSPNYVFLQKMEMNTYLQFRLNFLSLTSHKFMCTSTYYIHVVAESFLK